MRTKHKLDYGQLEDVLRKLAKLERYLDDFFSTFCYEIISSDTLESIVNDIEEYIDTFDMNYKENWEEYLDEDGNILPEYEDNDDVIELVNNRGYFDWIERVTGVPAKE